MEELDERSAKIRRIWIVIAILLALIAIGLLIYVFCFKDKKEKPKEEQSEPVEIKPTNNEENKEEENEKEEEEETVKTTYDTIIESSKFIDKVGVYSIYRDEKEGYLVDDENKKVVDSSKEGYTFAIPSSFLEPNNESECNLENISKCDYYTFTSTSEEKGYSKEKIYFVNKIELIRNQHYC